MGPRSRPAHVLYGHIVAPVNRVGRRADGGTLRAKNVYAIVTSNQLSHNPCGRPAPYSSRYAWIRPWDANEVWPSCAGPLWCADRYSVWASTAALRRRALPNDVCPYARSEKWMG